MSRLRSASAVHAPLDRRRVSPPSALRPMACAILCALAATSATFAWAPPAAAQAAGSADAPVRHFDIAANSLTAVLNQFGEQAGIFLTGSAELTQGKTSAGLRGAYRVQEGLAEILRGTGLDAFRRPDGSYGLNPSAAGTGGVTTLAPVAVQGGSTAVSAPLPPAYAGGQVARGGRLGVLGNKDFMETPFNTTSFTQKAIEDAQARSLADIVASADPSVRTGSGSSTIGDGFSIRGFSFESAEVAFNGVLGMAPMWRVMPESLERIEVLKGPNAFLNGATQSGSVGGAINIMPKRAGDKPNASVTADYASDSLGGGHVDLGRRFGQAHEFGIRVNGTYRNGDRARDNIDEESHHVAVGLDYTGERLRLEFDAINQRQVVHGAQWSQPALAASITEVPSVPSAKSNWSQPWERADVEDKIVTGKAEYDITDNLTVYAAAGHNKSDQYYVTSRATIEDLSGTLTQLFRTHATPYDTKTTNAGLRGRFTTGPVSHEWNFSHTYLRNEVGNKIGTVVPGSLTSNLYDPVTAPDPTAINMPDDIPTTSERRLSSFAVSDTLGFMQDRALLTLGLRRQRVQNRSFDGTTGAETANYDQFAVTPMAGALFKINPTVSVYANYIEGLSPGSAAPATAANAGEVFAPFKSRQVEAGVKFDLQSVAITTSVFQIRRASGGLDPVSLIYGINGQQRNRGIEVNVFGEPWRGLRVLGGVAYIDPKLTRAVNAAEEGNTAPNQPKARLNLFVEKDIDALPGLALNAGMVYSSSQYLNATNTYKIPSWTRFDVGARYRMRVAEHNLTLRATVRNVFDRDYWQQGLYVGDPRTILVSATLDF
ncbi:TonB-dependent receptor [Bordetella genomosp. 12]|nr:TonB-dependent receptor [Bordetella genomosp. 12]